MQQQQVLKRCRVCRDVIDEDTPLRCAEASTCSDECLAMRAAMRMRNPDDPDWIVDRLARAAVMRSTVSDAVTYAGFRLDD